MKNENPKILFISRAYPPVTGGIENQNYELAKWLSKITPTRIIANKYGKKFLPVFLPYCTAMALILAPKYDAIVLGDGVLGVTAWFVKLFYKKPVISVVHGLDLTYKSGFYQAVWVKRFIMSIDKFICVGQETVRVGIEKGIPAEKLVFIPNAIDTEKFFKECEREKLQEIVKPDVLKNKFILTSGRLAKRKGVAWFVRNVMPLLPENYIYIVAGDGADRENIESAIKEKNLSYRVTMLGFVTDEVRDTLFNTCDVFVQPNIKVEGDMEGFGISVIEAASCRIPVIASGIEGLKDAIKDGENGFLLESGNADAWAKKVTELLEQDEFRKSFGEKARQYVIDHYTWERISRQYLSEIEKEISKK